MGRQFWIIAVLLLCIAGSHAQEPDKVVRRLVKTGVFAFGGVGFFWVISPGEKDYERILSRPSAASDFEKLYNIGNPQAKSYALVGLHKLNPQRFAELALSLRTSKIRVVTMKGCVISDQLLPKVLRRIEAGRY